MIEQRADYDNPWKEALSLYFQPFMAFFFPEINGNINWSRGYEFLDKEFQQVVRDAEIGLREADKLVKVWRGDGAEVWVLIHVEIQSQAASDFAERMYVYNYRIFDMYRRSVVSLAVLADNQDSWRPNQYNNELWGCEVNFLFPTVKLLDYQQRSESLADNNPFAVIVAAHLTTQQTNQDPDGRYQGKLRIAKSLYQRGYSRQDILELFRLIDWMMSLPESIESQFKQEIMSFEEDLKMPYVTSFERLARQEGISEGILQSSRENVIEVLEVRFEVLPSDLIEKINQIEDLELLKTLHRQGITIGSLDEFQELLEGSS
ncbi:transposase [Cyanothece sp. BG0011]|uniref:transposase n=1 Tax=Cyanothece sp. BG0011 TaxID=2082950 RepID=UPI000D1DFBB9|nr:transposase [Cyanothece sp. BG0011]